MTARPLTGALAVFLLATLARAEKPRPRSFARFDWTASVSVFAGYDDNISISSLFRPGTKRGSGTLELGGRLGGELGLGELFEAELSYGFGQTFYFSDSELSSQSHALELEARLTHDRVEAALGYAFGVTALIPQGTFFSLDHEPSASVEVRLWRRLWAGVEYTLHCYDVRDAAYAYLQGERHTLELYPQLFLPRKLTLYGGYRLELLRVGALVDDAGGRAGTTVSVRAPLSSNGHYLFFFARWRPLARLALGLSGRVGRRAYLEPLVTTEATGTSSLSRTDTVLTLEPTARVFLWRGLSLRATFFFEKAFSSVSVRGLLAPSYYNVAASAGVAWER